MFKSIAKNLVSEIEARKKILSTKLDFGIKFLDDALRGILSDDMILIGAQSGVGKTQLVTMIAKANISRGKRVHLLALESSKHEIERRIKFGYVSDLFFNSSPETKPEVRGFNFTDWAMGKFLEPMMKLELKANDLVEKDFNNLFLFTKGDRFGVSEMIESIVSCQDETDLIIIDHAHYFDYDGDNENKALKEIAKTVRTLAIDISKPIILVAHLRKRDRNNTELAPGMEEFHGSSDLFKIATKVITIAPGRPTDNGNYETFFRIPKNRIDGTVTRYLGSLRFDPRKGIYKNEYKIGWSTQTGAFEELGDELYPSWAKGFNASGSNNFIPSRKQAALEDERRAGITETMPGFN